MSEIRLVLKLDGTDSAQAALGQFSSTISTAVEQGVSKAQLSINNLTESVKTLLPAFNGIGAAITLGLAGVGNSVEALIGKINSLTGGLNSARGAAQSFAASYPGFDPNEFPDAARNLAAGTTGRRGSQYPVGQPNWAQTSAAADQYDRAAADRATEMQRRVELMSSKMEQAATTADQRDWESQRSAYFSSAARRRQISDFGAAGGSAYATPGVLGGGRAAEQLNAAVGQYAGNPQDVDAMMANIASQGKLQGAAQKAAERADDAAARAAQREFNAIVDAIEKMGDQERAAGQKIAAQRQQEAGRLQGNAAADSVLGEGGVFTSGYRTTSQRLAPDGSVQSESATRAAGLFRNSQTLSINRETGEFTRNVQSMTSEWSKFVQAVLGDGSGLSKAFMGLTSPLRAIAMGIRAIDGAWNSVGNNLIRISALFYSAERAFGIARGATVGPYEAVLRQGEDAQRFRGSIAGTVGGLDNATAIDDALPGVARNSPLTISQVRQITTQLTSVSPLAAQLSASTPGQAGDLSSKLVDIVSRLSIANPQSNPEEIAKAVALATLGNLRGLRMTARVDINDLATLSGMSQKELMTNQDAMLRALGLTARSRTSDSALAQQANLPSVQLEKIQSEWNLMLQQIALKSDLFGTVTQKFGDMIASMIRYADSDAFRATAKAIGDDMASIFNSFIKGAQGFLQAASGSHTLADTPEAIGDQIKDMTHSIAGFAEWLPKAGPAIGDAFNIIITALESFLGKISMAADSFAERAAYMENVLNHGGQPTTDRAQAEKDLINRLTGQYTVDLKPEMWMPGGAAPGPTGNYLAAARNPQDAAFVQAIIKGIQDKNYQSVNGVFPSEAEIISNIVRPNAVGRNLPGAPATLASLIASMRQSMSVSHESSGGGTSDNRLGPDADRFSAENVYDKQASFAWEAIKALRPPDARDDKESGLSAEFMQAVKDINELLHYQQSKLSENDGLRSQYQGILKGNPGDEDAIAKLKMLDANDAALRSQLEPVMTELAQQLRLNSADRMIADTMGIKDPAERLRQMQFIQGGQADFQKSASDAGYPVLLGDASNDKQLEFLQSQTGLGLDQIKQGAANFRNGLLSSKRTPGTVPLQSSLLGGPGALDQQAGFLKGQLGLANNVADSAYRDYQDTFTNGSSLQDTEKAYEAYQKADEYAQKLTGDIRQLQLESNRGIQAAMEFANKVQEGFEHSVGDMFSSLITGAHNFVDIMRNLAKSLLNDFTQSVSQTAFRSMVRKRGLE